MEGEKAVVVFLMLGSPIVRNTSLCSGLVEKHQFLRRDLTARKDRHDCQER